MVWSQDPLLFFTWFLGAAEGWWPFCFFGSHRQDADARSPERQRPPYADNNDPVL